MVVLTAMDLAAALKVSTTVAMTCHFSSKITSTESHRSVSLLLA